MAPTVKTSMSPRCFPTKSFVSIGYVVFVRREMTASSCMSITFVNYPNVSSLVRMDSVRKHLNVCTSILIPRQKFQTVQTMNRDSVPMVLNAREDTSEK